MGFLNCFPVKKILFVAACFSSMLLEAQELYPYTEPASNMPAHSVAAKLGAMFEKHRHTGRLMQRYSPEVMLGLNKKWMVHGAATFADMHSTNLRGESVRLYAKYRFLSNDAVHRHFRMAAFALGSYSRTLSAFNEINLMGDQSGVQAGVIATQLYNKLALSATASHAEVLHKNRWQKDGRDTYAWQAVQYSVSAGYLLLPFQYRSYNQTNLNLYAELLGSRNLGVPAETFFVDLAPSIQFIFSSTSKLNLGYRFQLAGNINRLANRSVMVSYEHIFLNALRKKKSGK
jgi:hypothetical protein